MAIHTYEQLTDKTLKELEEVKKQKQNELFDINKKKYILIGNILSLQKLIEIERENKNA